MPFHNIISSHFTDTEIADINDLMAQIEAIMQPKLINLSAKENKQFGRIQEQKKLFTNKVFDYHTHQPDLQCPDVDWTEFEQDYKSRQFLQGMQLRLKGLEKATTETKRLHDFDNYQNALLDKEYADYKSKTDISLGYDKKAEVLQQFFARKKNKK